MAVRLWRILSAEVFSNPEMSLKGGFEAGSFRRLLCGDFLTCFSS
jgi:hypothetical protein